VQPAAAGGSDDGGSGWDGVSLRPQA
jgi:hypothetical protein